MSIIGIDPQPIGWSPSPSDQSGAIRGQPLQGDLVALPIRASQYWVETANVSATLRTEIFTGNPDGTGSAIQLAGPTSGGDGGMRLWLPFTGRVFGVRWQHTTLTPNFSVAVDGVAVGVEGQHPLLTREGMGGQIVDRFRQQVTHTDLSPGQHYAEIIVVAEPGATSKPLILYGYLVDRNAGYKEVARASHVATTAPLTTTPTAIPLQPGGGSSSPERLLVAVDKIVYANITASPVTVTIEYGTGVVMWSRSIPANDTVIADFGGLNMNSVSFKHYAAANSAVNATVIGRN